VPFTARQALQVGGALVALWALPVHAADPFTAMGVAPVTPPEAAQGFSLSNLDDEEVRLADLAGKVVILNFWATWCIPCREEMPHLEALWREYRDQGLVVLAVSEDGGRVKRVRKFVSKLGITYPVLLDRERDVGVMYRVSGLPASALIDRRGNVVGRVIGFRDWTGADAHALIRQLLGPTE
jgi:peroxiredoxin